MTLREPATAGEFSLVRLPDEIDLSNSSEVLASLFTAINRGGPNLVVDARDVRFLDSSGLNALVRAKERSEAMNGTFHLVAASRRVTRLLEITRLDGLLRHVESMDAAVACVASPSEGHVCAATGH